MLPQQRFQVPGSRGTSELPSLVQASLNLVNIIVTINIIIIIMAAVMTITMMIIVTAMIVSKMINPRVAVARIAFGCFCACN